LVLITANALEFPPVGKKKVVRTLKESGRPLVSQGLELGRGGGENPKIHPKIRFAFQKYGRGGKGRGCW